MRFNEATKGFRVGLRHNPRHFQTNSFRVETEGNRLVLVAVVKRKMRKRFRIVGILKPR